MKGDSIETTGPRYGFQAPITKVTLSAHMNSKTCTNVMRLLSDNDGRKVMKRRGGTRHQATNIVT